VGGGASIGCVFIETLLTVGLGAGGAHSVAATVGLGVTSVVGVVGGVWVAAWTYVGGS